MTSIDQTAFARLETEGRLLKPSLKAETHKSGRFGFRGDIGIESDTVLKEVFATAEGGEPHISFIAGQLEHFKDVKPLTELLGDAIKPDGKYFFYCHDLEAGNRYLVPLGGAKIYVLPIDEATVYNELLELLYLDKTSLKKASTAGKTDAIADAALKFDGKFAPISFAQGVERMGPVRDRYADRPV